MVREKTKTPNRNETATENQTEMCGKLTQKGHVIRLQRDGE